MKIFHFFILFFFLFSFSEIKSLEIKVLATVNNQAISNYDLFIEVKSQELLNNRIINQSQHRQILQQMIDETIRESEVKKNNIIADKKKVNVKINEIHKLKKKRYSIMRDYMPKVGTLGLDMMHRTAATQVNFDFSSEDDFRKKTKVASCLVPVAVSLFSNSPILEGKLNGYIGYRTNIWQHTDDNRSGLIPFFFDKENSYEQYLIMH